MMKKCLILSLVLLLVPACKDTARFTMDPPKPATSSSAVQNAPIEHAEYDEELGAFVVKDDDNKFSAAAAAQAHQEEELTATDSEPTVGDTHTDSAQYGLKPIYFEFNKYKTEDLQPDQRPVLEHNVIILRSLAEKGYKISIEGHACDSAGSTEYNVMLSEDRARTVKEALEEKGVHGEILYVGYGCQHLIVPAGDKIQQTPNRRVEIYAYLADSN